MTSGESVRSALVREALVLGRDRERREGQHVVAPAVVVDQLGVADHRVADHPAVEPSDQVELRDVLLGLADQTGQIGHLGLVREGRPDHLLDRRVVAVLHLLDHQHCQSLHR